MGLRELGRLLEAQKLVGGYVKGRRKREDDLGGGIARLGFVVGDHPAGDLRLVRELLLGEAGRLAQGREAFAERVSGIFARWHGQTLDG